MLSLINLLTLVGNIQPTVIQGEHDRHDRVELTPYWTQERNHGQGLYDEIQLDSYKHSWVSALSEAWTSPERTVDLASLGIDLGTVFDRLLSPAGIVNQYALSIVIQLMGIVGYIATGLGYGLMLDRTSAGPLLDILMYFDVILSPQAIFTTVARSTLKLVWELAARVITTAFLFGVFESVSQIFATTTLQSVWTFVTSQNIKEITLWRVAFGSLFVFAFYPILTLLGPLGNQVLGRQFSEETNIVG